MQAYLENNYMYKPNRNYKFPFSNCYLNSDVWNIFFLKYKYVIITIICTNVNLTCNFPNLIQQSIAMPIYLLTRMAPL